MKVASTLALTCLFCLIFGFSKAQDKKTVEKTETKTVIKNDEIHSNDKADKADKEKVVVKEKTVVKNDGKPRKTETTVSVTKTEKDGKVIIEKEVTKKPVEGKPKDEPAKASDRIKE